MRKKKKEITCSDDEFWVVRPMIPKGTGTLTYSNDSIYTEFEKHIKEEFKGYHPEISFWPTGGSIYVFGCEECGTKGSHSELWLVDCDYSIDDAVENLKRKIKDAT